MESIYNVIQENPEYFAWLFGVVNALWGVFMYFNKQTHDKNLKKVEQDLRYQADRRLKVFDLKAREYSNYVTELDAFGRKAKVELPERMQPIFDEYLKRYMTAIASNNEDDQREVVAWFTLQIAAFMREGQADLLKLKFESNRLKLIATDEMLVTFESIEQLTTEAMEHANTFMKGFISIVINEENDKAKEYQVEANRLGKCIQEKTDLLLKQMRNELSEI
ncbi:hypothetical protein KI655_22630 [Vibrio sp. D404a]|uniref:hypothetical protein n=1 Tax=unclassified Vibrio TaxID=2614977 RepID=UPI00255562C0|nr:MULTISPECIES: hypothetical protein [unclassified Vibrio]MDK9740100.1 hypothetical protein [Vibrio sp. D404a]MDK9799333.1 hypothetical protein [Vibrio sp. D449a]